MAEIREEREEMEKQRRNTSLDGVTIGMSLSHTLHIIDLSLTFLVFILRVLRFSYSS